MKRSTLCGSVWLVLALLHLGSSRAAASFRNCDDDQIGQISLAFLTAVPYLDAAKKELTNIRNGGDRSHFELWFGYVDDERLSYVEELVDASYSAGIGNAAYICGPSFACGDPSVRAWTEHGSAVNNSFGVFVCQSFYAEDTTYQAGILVHEYSHLFGTDDFFEDEAPSREELQSDEKKALMDAALRLAVNTPDEAIYVAYNFGFFVMDR